MTTRRIDESFSALARAMLYAVVTRESALASPNPQIQRVAQRQQHQVVSALQIINGPAKHIRPDPKFLFQTVLVRLVFEGLETLLQRASDAQTASQNQTALQGSRKPWIGLNR